MTNPSNIINEVDYVEYSEVIEKFSKKKVQERYQRLLESAQRFIREAGQQNHVECNETMLKLAVLGYYSDIIRLKKFHNIEQENDVKNIAYETSWLLKRRPLQIIQSTEDSNDQKYAFCNEQFAFSQIMFWFTEGNSDGRINVFVQEELEYFSDALFYHLKYRQCDAQILELMLVSFMAGRKYQSLLLSEIEKS